MLGSSTSWSDPSFWLREDTILFLLLLSKSLMRLMPRYISWPEKWLLAVAILQPFWHVGLPSTLNLFFHHPVSSAHRYHQAKASGQGQGGQSKSSSAHSSRSTSPGPHWRNDAIAPYKPPDRRSLEPSSAASASSSSTRPGRSRNPSGSSELDSGAARTLLPKPPRDRSEPRHFNPLRWVWASVQVCTQVIW